MDQLIIYLRWCGKYNNVMLMLKYKWKLRLQLSLGIINESEGCWQLSSLINQSINQSMIAGSKLFFVIVLLYWINVCGDWGVGSLIKWRIWLIWLLHGMLQIVLLDVLFLAVHNRTKWRKSWFGHQAISDDSWSEDNHRSTGISFSVLYITGSVIIVKEN